MNILRRGNVGTVALVLCGLLCATRTYGEDQNKIHPWFCGFVNYCAVVHQPSAAGSTIAQVETDLEVVRQDITDANREIKEVKGRLKSVEGRESSRPWLLVDLVLLVAAFLGGHALWRTRVQDRKKLSQVEEQLGKAVAEMKETNESIRSRLLGIKSELNDARNQREQARERERSEASEFLRSERLTRLIDARLGHWEDYVVGAVLKRIQNDPGRRGEAPAGEGAFEQSLKSAFDGLRADTGAVLNEISISRSPVGQRHVAALISALGAAGPAFASVTEGLQPEPDGQVMEIDDRHKKRTLGPSAPSRITLRDVVEAALDLRTLQVAREYGRRATGINTTILPTIAMRFFEMWSETNDVLPSAATLDELNALLSHGDLELLIPEVGVRPSSVDVEVNEVVYDTGLIPRSVVEVLRPGLRYRGGLVLTRARVNAAG